MSRRPSILMVFTGGTISMRAVPGRGVVPARSGAEILALFPGGAGTGSVWVPCVPQGSLRIVAPRPEGHMEPELNQYLDPPLRAEKASGYGQVDDEARRAPALERPQMLFPQPFSDRTR